MSLSWSQKLFLKINSQIGRRYWLDELMKFSAQWLIYFFTGAVIVWALIQLEPVQFKLFVKLILTALAFSLGLSWLGALLLQYPRPIQQFPEIKELLRPFQVFKSFPSDHTIMSFTLYLMAVLNGAGWILAVAFFILASLIALSRIYVGAHYPRDIVGGMVYALVFSLLSFWLLGNITQPVYVWLINLL